MMSMRLARVVDCDVGSLKNARFDLAIFASGYEKRCPTLRMSLGPSNIETSIVLGFDNAVTHAQRVANDEAFRARGHAITIVNKRDDKTIIGKLVAIKPRLGKNCRVLIDYSSMSRFWVNTILNYFKFDPDFQEIDIFFSYTVSEHVDADSYPNYPTSDYEIIRIESLPTLEGAAVRQRQTLAIIGLGFDWVGPFAACDLVEPDEVIACCAQPGAFPNYGDVARQKNSEFLKEFTRGHAMSLPLRSVEAVYRQLSEIIAPALEQRNVMLIPLGPKPHILASILVANRFPQATCLYVEGHRANVLQVTPTLSDDFVATKVTLRRSENSSIR